MEINICLINSFYTFIEKRDDKEYTYVLYIYANETQYIIGFYFVDDADNFTYNSLTFNHKTIYLNSI